MAVGMIWGNAGVPLTTSPTNLEAAGMNQIYKVKRCYSNQLTSSGGRLQQRIRCGVGTV
jgi:hypothetical protein